MSTTNIDPRWADIDFDKVNAELRDLRAQVGRLQAHIDRTQPVVAGADGYVEPEAPKVPAPLMKERVTEIYNEVCADWINRYNRPLIFAREIEAAHGIGGTNG